ncbi:MAG: hypothetical protein R2792_01880 [Saprospiraceae bacterium]
MLSDTWFMEGNIDFESKKYTLLGYLQKVSACFGENKLYPELSEIVFHYNNLNAFRENKQLLQNQFPKRLTGIQLERLRLLYEEMISDNELMQEIEAIVQFAMHKLQHTIESGTDLYDFVEDRLSITPVGILPLETDDGYFYLCDGSFREILVYKYRLSIFEKSNAQYRTLKVAYIDSWERNFTNSYESIKAQLMRAQKPIQVPAVYSIETELTFPIHETLLPIAKRSLVRHISKG